MLSVLSRFLSRFLRATPVVRDPYREMTCDILFLCSSSVDEVWIRSTAIACHRRKLSVCIAICGDAQNSEGFEAVYEDAGFPCFSGLSFAQAASIGCEIAVTASSGLDRDIFPTSARWFVHMPHSLASLHMIYPEDAFYGYDVLFAAGPQHTSEFREICARGALEDREAFPVGYGKLDVLQDALETSQSLKGMADRKRVLVAPSWGPDNLMERCGIDLVKALLVAGVAVTVRPHPLFFLEKAPIVDEFKALEAEYAFFDLEPPFEEDAAIFVADLLIGDYSGISFEFAALRRRPVISVDVGLKVVNQNWQSFESPPVEIRCRSKIGAVVQPDIGEILTHVIKLLKGEQGGFVSDAVVSEFLYSKPGSCCENAATLLQEMMGRNQQ